MNTMNIIGTFHMVVKVNDGVSLDDLLFKETEWIGEPTSPNGCVITMTPKKYEILKSGVISENEKKYPVIKAIKDKDRSKWNKRPEAIIQALKSPDGHSVIVQDENNNIAFNKPISDFIGHTVMVDEKTLLVVGEK